MDSTTLGSEKCEYSIPLILFLDEFILLIVEFAVLTLDEETKQLKAKIYRPKEIDDLLLAEGLTKKEEDTAMKS